MEPIELKPLSLSDIFDQCFTLLARVYKRLFSVGAVILFPTAIVVWLLFRNFFAFFGIYGDSLAGVPDSEAMLGLSKAIGGMSVGILILLIAETILFVSYTLIVCGETVGRRYETREALSLAFSGRGAKAVAQRFLANAAASLVYLVPYTLFIVILAIDISPFTALISFLFMFLGIGLFIYLRVRWAFGVTTISWEERGIFEAFGRSSELVNGNGWRVFGILALFSLMAGFAINLILTPVQFFVLWDVLVAYIAMFSDLASNPENVDPSGIFTALKNLGASFALLIGLSVLLTTTVKSIYISTLYFDLRARQDEFNASLPDIR